MTINSLKNKTIVKNSSPNNPLSLAFKHQIKSPLKKNIFLNSGKIKVSPFILNRFADHVQNDDKFFVLVLSKSDQSPSYLISTNDYNQNNNLTFVQENDPEETYATTPKGTKLYSRLLAITESGGKSLVILSPTPAVSPNKQKNPSKRNKAPTHRKLFNDDSSSNEKQPPKEILKNSCTLQCSSPNKNYQPRIHSPSQQSTMKGQSASKAVKEAIEKSKRSESPLLNIKSTPHEWCHLLAYRYSQFRSSSETPKNKNSFIPQSQGNLIASTRFVNTKMIVLEHATTYLLNHLPPSFSLRTSTECDVIPDSNNVMCDVLRQKISVMYEGKPVFTFQQTIKHDFGLCPGDRKKLAAVKDLTAISAFVMTEMKKRVKDSALLTFNVSDKSPSKSTTKKT